MWKEIFFFSSLSEVISKIWQVVLKQIFSGRNTGFYKAATFCAIMFHYSSGDFPLFGGDNTNTSSTEIGINY